MLVTKSEYNFQKNSVNEEDSYHWCAKTGFWNDPSLMLPTSGVIRYPSFECGQNL